jgi:serine/threonine protein kinase/Tol biopolymer transport system component
MALEPGTKLGPYEVLARIGGGSEGDERYKASDTRVNRFVTLQVLPELLSGQPDAKERIERDTRTISALKHPNICGLLEIGHQEPSTDFLVTEYVEGETLAQRLVRGPLALDEALKIAIAIADSLDKAHRQGVTHGGLNPSVVLLTESGPKLLDFGIAKLKDGSRSPAGSSMATTRASVPSLAGAPPAGAAYMSPEQLGGEIADTRSDIFSFGAILYEMVTGKPAFEEKTLALLIASVQSVEPEDVSKVQPLAPPALSHLIKRASSKDPKKRLQTAWDLMVQLKWIAEGGTQVGLSIPIAVSRKKHDRMLWVALAALLIIAAALSPAIWSRFKAAPASPEARFVLTGFPSNQTPITVSPDGRWLTAIVGGPAARGVFALPLNSVATQDLIKDNNVTQPFWSPDSRSMAFFEDGKLKKAEISGGPAQNICEVTNPIGGGSWSSDGVMLFSAAGRIYKVAANGGQPVAITELDKSKQETDHLGPNFLPDGRHYLYLAVGSESAIYLSSIDSKERTRLIAADSKPLYAAPGYILFNRGITVFAQPFDAKKLVLTGEPIRVADNVPTIPAGPNANTNLARTGAYAVSQTGVLAFKTNQGGQAPGGSDEQRSLFWYDRNGGRSAAIGPPGTYAGIDLSSDGKRFLVHRHEGTGGDNWLYDLSQGRLQRLTFDASQENASPIWSPDGTRIAFTSIRKNKWGIYTKLADGTGNEDLITESEAVKEPMSWSPDGKLIVFVQVGQARDIWAVPVAGDKKPFPLLQSPAAEAFPQVSPDGKWLAYQSNETGRAEIYIKPFPDGPGKWQVSTDGGSFPRWRRDGRELYFELQPNVMSAEIRVVGSSVQPGVPQILFPLANSPNTSINHNTNYLNYAVTPDGKSFLISQPTSGSGAATAAGGLADQIAAVADRGTSSSVAIPPFSVTVVLNWTQMLKRK